MLVFTGHYTRRTHPGGVTTGPARKQTVQQARNLALSPGQRSGEITFVLRDRGPDFTASAGAVFQQLAPESWSAPSRHSG